MVINMDVSLIIPVYNESKIILNTIRTASKKLAELTSSYEIWMMAVPTELPLWSKTAETPMCF